MSALLKPIPISCNRCGVCCSSLIKTKDGISKGLFLTEKERDLFNYDVVKPSRALGRKKPEKVISYQLSVSPCPHLEGNVCKIYEKRPLTCKAYPFQISLSNDIDTDCTEIRKVLKPNEHKFFDPPLESKEALNKIRSYFTNRVEKYMKTGYREWNYDLSSNEWIVRSSLS